MARKIGILGDGNVGSALARGLKRAGHEVRAVGEDPAAIRDVAAWGEIVILAVPFGAIDDVVKTAGEALSGKTVIDVTNALDDNMNLAIGHTTSGAEELQKKLPRSKVVKAFNTVFAQHMDTGKLGDKPLTASSPATTPRRRRRFSSWRDRSASTRWTQGRPRTRAFWSRSASSIFSWATASKWARRSASPCGTSDRENHRCRNFRPRAGLGARPP